MQAPRFWQRGGSRLVPALLMPLSVLTAAATARRVARPGWRAPVPVLCCGNVTVGGSGKTTLALDLLGRLAAAGATPHALLRGYGGSAEGVRLVAPADDVAETGDEALLLAQVAPTWIGGDRAATARAAVAAGADGLIIEVHPDPERALSDGVQSLYPEQFAQMMDQVRAIAPAVGRKIASGQVAAVGR